MRRPEALLVCVPMVAVLIGGCKDQKSALEQQRLLLDTIKTQQDTLATLDKRKQELAELEKGREDRARELQGREEAITERERKVEATSAELKAYEKKLTEYRTATEGALQQLKQERELAEARAEFAKKRLPFLERLAGRVGKDVAPDAPTPPGVKKPIDYDRARLNAAYQFGEYRQYIAQTSEYYYHRFLRDLIDSGVTGIADDDQFEDSALKLAKAFVLRYAPSYAATKYTRKDMKEEFR